jgi:hypothetical protein
MKLQTDRVPEGLPWLIWRTALTTLHAQKQSDSRSLWETQLLLQRTCPNGKIV